MTTLTLKLSDTMAERLSTLATVQGEDINNYALAQLENLLETDEVETIISIQQGLAELDAGEGQPVEEFHTEMMAKLATRKARLLESKTKE